jgi:hypothetical protein
MITAVAPRNMVTIPAEIGKRYKFKPGYRLDWQPQEDDFLPRKPLFSQGLLVLFTSL